MKNHILLNSMFLLFLGSMFVATTTKESSVPPLSTTAILLNDTGDYLFLAQKTMKRVDMLSRKGMEVMQSWDFENDPTGLALKNNKLYVTSSHGKGFLTIIDLNSNEKIAHVKLAMGATNPVVNASGTKLYVCNQYANKVSEIDLENNEVTRTVAVLREPKEAVLSADGHYLYVANFLPDGQADLEVVTAKVSVIDTRTFEKIKDIPLTNGSNALRGMCLSADGRYVFVSHNLGRFQVPTSQLQQGWMNTSGMSILNTATQTFEGTILLDEPEYGAAGIWGIACDEKRMLISHSGTHDISVIDYPEFITRFEATENKEELSYDLRFLTGIRRRVPVEGNGPRVLVLDKNEAIIPTYFSDLLNVMDLENDKITTHALNPNFEETLERQGERLFNDASYCFQSWQSCNGCHPGDARTDGLNWDLLNDGIGNSKNCKSLLFSHPTPPSMISGIRPDAETAVRAGFKHIQFAEISEEKASLIDAYLKSLRPLPSPYLVEGKLSEKAERGKRVFEQKKCGYCHSGPFFTDLKQYRIGEVEFEQGWDTPTLREVWRTAPYLHDGSAATIESLLKDKLHGLDGQKIKEKELQDLIEYVKSL